MYIVIGASALRLLRTIRCGAYEGLRVALPYVELPERACALEYETPLIAPPLEPNSHGTHIETLREAGFDFAHVIANLQVELSKFGNVCKPTKQRPLELGVFDSGRRSRLKKMSTSMLSPNLPSTALIRLDPDVYMASPELIVTQMASRMSVSELAQLIMELCGTYSLSPYEDQEARFERDPATSLERLRRFEHAAPRIQGRPALRAALDMALEGSASPGETNTALCMGTPIQHGGWGLGPFLLNAELKVPSHHVAHVGGTHYRLDVFSQKFMASLEYEGIRYHLDPITAGWTSVQLDDWRRMQVAKAQADRLRSRDLQALGIEVIPVMSLDFRSVDRLNRVAWALARRGEALGRLNLHAWEESLDTPESSRARTEFLSKLTSG